MMDQKVSDDELHSIIMDSRFGSKLKFAIDLHHARARVSSLEESLEAQAKRIRELEQQREGMGAERVECAEIYGKYKFYESKYNAVREKHINTLSSLNALKDAVRHAHRLAVDNKTPWVVIRALNKALTESGGSVPAERGESRTVGSSGTPNRPAALLLVRDGVPYRKDAQGYRPLDTVLFPCDAIYKRAWEALEYQSGPKSMVDYSNGKEWTRKGKPPDGLYALERVGDCGKCGGQGEWLAVEPHKLCPTCGGDGGRYELRAVEE
jgi:hypothetical protein